MTSGHCVGDRGVEQENDPRVVFSGTGKQHGVGIVALGETNGNDGDGLVGPDKKELPDRLEKVRVHDPGGRRVPGEQDGF